MCTRSDFVLWVENKSDSSTVLLERQHLTYTYNYLIPTTIIEFNTAPSPTKNICRYTNYYLLYKVASTLLQAACKKFLCIQWNLLANSELTLLCNIMFTCNNWLTNFSWSICIQNMTQCFQIYINISISLANMQFFKLSKTYLPTVLCIPRDMFAFWVLSRCTPASLNCPAIQKTVMSSLRFW